MSASPAPGPDAFPQGLRVEGPVRVHLPLALEADHARVRKGFLPKLLRLAGYVPFADDLAAAWFCTRDPATPRQVKAVLMAALAYFVLPVDAIPDVLVGLGFTDDGAVLATTIGMVGAHIRPEHRRAARRLLRMPEPAQS